VEIRHLPESLQSQRLVFVVFQTTIPEECFEGLGGRLGSQPFVNLLLNLRADAPMVFGAMLFTFGFGKIGVLSNGRSDGFTALSVTLTHALQQQFTVLGVIGGIGAGLHLYFMMGVKTLDAGRTRQLFVRVRAAD
jgi:hypothetical protein